MLKRTEGIVLRTFPFGEADLIVTHLTPDLGIIKSFAKSSRKTRSRFGSSLEPLTRSRISLFGKEDAVPLFYEYFRINGEKMRTQAKKPFFFLFDTLFLS